MSTEFVSGEIYFRSKPQSLKFFENTLLLGLHNFLYCDADKKLQLIQGKRFLDSLRNIRDLHSAIYDKIVHIDNQSLACFIEASCREKVEYFEALLKRAMDDVSRLQYTADAKLMELVLQYFAILKDELNTTRERLHSSFSDGIFLKQQAKKLRDIQIFGKHLNIETKGNVTLEVLDIDSLQYKRCAKAIRENLKESKLLEARFVDISILNVIKIEHSIISKRLQVQTILPSYITFTMYHFVT